MEEFGDIADFLAVYVMEAHTSDHWRLGSFLSVAPQHTSLSERRACARRLRDKFDWSMPIAVDTMANSLHHAYAVWPERLIIVLDGTIAFLQRSNPGGVATAWTTDAATYLREFRAAKARHSKK